MRFSVYLVPGAPNSAPHLLTVHLPDCFHMARTQRLLVPLVDADTLADALEVSGFGDAHLCTGCIKEDA